MSVRFSCVRLFLNNKNIRNLHFRHTKAEKVIKHMMPSLTPFKFTNGLFLLVSAV